jgi:amino acid adenylation domain-containing protein
VLSILAVMKTGAAYLPIDPTYPKARVEHMLRDSGAKLLLTERPFLGEFEGIDVHTLAERPWRALPQPRDRSIERLAYVIYTSGSTGVPKGVRITHRNVARLLESTDPLFRFGSDDVWLLFHSPAFDFSVWELWGALLYGARLVIPSYVVSRDPQAVYELVEQERVTVLNQTPSAFRQFDAVDRERRAHLALRCVVFAGEMLDPAALAGWFERHGDETPRMINMYGITETTVHVTWRRIVRGDVGSGSVIGRPIDGWLIHLLDRHGNLAPLGVAGEIHVAGDGVAQGYLNRAELTAERFLDDRFSHRGTLYRSGDLARRLPDGDLEYLGRIDHQVKVRGFRIELGEIEHCLAEHPSIGDAAVLPVGTDDSVELVAFLFNASAVRTRELRQFLRRSLPAYMIPGRFITVAERPLTSNGKLDRRLLLSMASDGGAA